MTDTAPADDVYRQHAYLREHDPVTRAGGGPWRVARYEDVRRVLRSHEEFSSQVSDRLSGRAGGASLMLFCDPPVHDRLRALVSRAFTPRRVAEQEARIVARCEALVREMARSERADLVTALAAPLPVGVIAGMLGVEDGDFAEFKRWSDAVFKNIGDILLRSPSEAAMAAVGKMDAYFLEQIARLRREPQPHLLSDLVHVETEDGRLSDAELLMFCRLLLIAGNETTTSLIVGCVRVFHELPETFERLARARDLIPGFIEETLRYYSPFRLTIRRARRDVTLAGQTIQSGELVLPLIASANRDESVFERAAEFVIERDPNPHLAFGLGIHSCLGSALARLEGRIAVAALLEQLERIELDEPNGAQLDAFGAPTSVPVRLRAFR